MKKPIFLSVVILSMLMFTMNVAATSYTLTFTATGASSTIDHVVVNNLTKGTTATVSGGSTLLLTDVTSVPQLDVDMSLRIAPNPILSQSKVSFYSAKGGFTMINVSGLDGKIIKGLVENLHPGDNEFMLSLPKGVFVLHINDKENTHTAKVISHNNNRATIEFSEITTVSISISNKVNSPNKVNSATISMNYSEGDVLVFKAHAGNLVSILGDIITSNKAINFKMVECVDQEGKYYPVVTIGTQTWMAENLNTNRFRNNVAIADKTNDASWGSTTSAAYSNYDATYH